MIGLPGDLLSSTIYGSRITEWQLPLSSISPSVGETLYIGGAVDVGDGFSYTYPVDLDWNTESTFVPITVIPEPATIGLLGLGALSLLRRKRSKA